ncbi:hypothetical protein Goshw_012773 [Gossypium schwendimanii]|uniref:RNase H type-1 domain-containing protein n=1 Tax=Gossypium schwendimanii TaxID=34291 RepID=A0A7J9MBC0_GOSSC|nr:hypothetical protein [Gossypium schwendimanii]
MATLYKRKRDSDVVGEEGVSSESVTNVCSCSSSCPPLEDDSSDTSLRLGQLEIECNDALLVESVLIGRAASSNLVELRFINCYLNRNLKTRISHILRFQNMATDQMAKCTYDNQIGLKLFEYSLISVQEILLSDNDFLSRVI